MLLPVVQFYCNTAGLVSPTACNHVVAALRLLENFPHRDEDKKFCSVAKELLKQRLNTTPSIGSLKEVSLIASRYDETSLEQQGRNKRKEIDRDTPDEPPLKKFRGDRKLFK